MLRIGFVLLLCIGFGCNSEKSDSAEVAGFSFEGFSNLFKEAALPYVLSDTGLLNKKDTASIRSKEFEKFIPDSLKKKIFPKGSKVKYYPLAKVKDVEGETYFIVRAAAGSKKTALLLAFDNAGNYGAAFPFLIPDTDPVSSQVSSIDRSLNISRNITRKRNNEILGEGKDVYVYNSGAKTFTLIMTDLLDERTVDLINPIDTLSRTIKYSGDYVKGKRNIISIRDGRGPKQAVAFVHLESNDGECIGELKGNILFTSSNTAIYRQGGDPCVLQFTFTNSAVTLKEEQGCGNYRGLDCPMEGTYTKKKESKPKSTNKRKPKK